MEISLGKIRETNTMFAAMVLLATSVMLGSGVVVYATSVIQGVP